MVIEKQGKNNIIKRKMNLGSKNLLLLLQFNLCYITLVFPSLSFLAQGFLLYYSNGYSLTFILKKNFLFGFKTAVQILFRYASSFTNNSNSI